MSKPGCRDEARAEQTRRADAVDAEVTQAGVAILVAGDEVAAHPEQHAVRRHPALGHVGAGVGDGEQERPLQRLGDGLEHAGFGPDRRTGAGGVALRLQHRLGVGLGAARVRAGHAGEQAVAQRRERRHVRRGALALGAADRHLERGELVVADALEAGEARVAQLPAAPAVLVGADLHAGEGVLERADHALRGAVVGAELLGDLGERDPLVTGRCHLGEAHEASGLGQRHRSIPRRTEARISRREEKRQRLVL